MRELRPLAEIGRGGLVFAASAAVPTSNLKEALAFIKSQPGKINYASYSSGSVSRTLGLELNQVAGLDMTHVGYKGAPPALQDLMGGQVQFMFDGIATSLPLIKAGRIRALATTAPQRVGVLSEVPTFAELGYKDLTEVAWLGLWTTPDAPTAAHARVREAALKVGAQPQMRERLTALGIDPGTAVTPEAMMAGLKTSYERQGETLKAIGFKPV